MKKTLIVVAFSLFLFACTNTDDTPTEVTDKTQEIDETQIDSQEVSVAQEGELCGGTENKKCEQGFECEREPDIAFETGTCINTVVDKEIVCDKVQKPVCGLKNERLNGYLNECEALRHGAVIQNDGFCKEDTALSQNCEAKSQIIGRCDNVFKLTEFNGTECVSKAVQACDAYSPFDSQNACEVVCEV